MAAAVGKTRRTRIPDRPKISNFNIFGYLKNNIGKELTQIAIPINFSEPLSFLQRLCENLEYTNLLNHAADCECQYEQLAYLLVFIITGYASSNRTTKPFNPLLGETYEWDRTDDLGWRVINEQISHHPPRYAQYCEGKKWIFFQDYISGSKLGTNELQITFDGISSIKFNENISYTWSLCPTVVRNFLIGNIFVEHLGEINVVNESVESLKGVIKFNPLNGGGSFFWGRASADNRKVVGEVLDADGNMQYLIEGTWNNEVRISKFENGDRTEPIIVWKCNELDKDAANFYNFSTFACQLNEPEENVAPTDSRLRPDQRLMENAMWDEASLEKTRLEETQRARAKEREKNQGELYQPVWFRAELKDEDKIVHTYRGNYWECKEKQDWSMCPDLFS